MKKLKYLVLLAFICASTLIFFLNTPPTNKQQILSLVKKGRQAVLANDYETFKTCMDNNHNKRFTQIEFSKLVKVVKDNTPFLDLVIPNLNANTEYLKLKVIGQWAAFYAKTDLDDLNHYTVSVVLFHRINNKWRICGKSHGLSKARPESEYAKTGRAYWKDEEEIMKTIDEDIQFDLERLKNEYLKKREPTNQ